MKKIITSDGFETYYNEDFKETYHSVSGAFEEAMEKYVNPLNIKDGDKILDFCFGLGYNSIAALSKYDFLEIIAIENDPEPIRQIANLNKNNELHHLFAIFSNFLQTKKIRYQNSEIKLLLEDASIAIKTLKSNYFDAIFFDPFSPKKHPEMWSENIFAEMYRILKPGGRLATYSCAGKVRKAMQLSGFETFDGPSVGRRAPATIAKKIKK